jgi:hypothetical protein
MEEPVRDVLDSETPRPSVVDVRVTDGDAPEVCKVSQAFGIQALLGEWCNPSAKPMSRNVSFVLVWVGAPWIASLSCIGQPDSPQADGGLPSAPWTAANSFSVCDGLVSDAVWYQSQMKDCGAWFTQPGRDDGGYAVGVECALEAQDAGQPFVLLTVTSFGVDTINQNYYFRTTSGDSQMLTQFWGILASSNVVTHCSGFAQGTGANQPLLCLSPSDGGERCPVEPADAGAR